MAWTLARDIKSQLTRLWERGELLRPLVSGEPCVPIRLALKGPSSTDITDRFEEVRAWAAELATVSHIRIERREVRHRVQGIQHLPEKIWVDTLDGALALLGKRREAEKLARMVEFTRTTIPTLLAWIEKRPLQAIEISGEWPRILAVAAWLAEHPRPGIYVRQVDIPGVHTKFIEERRALLSELLDLALPSEAIHALNVGASQFARRYGFLEKPIRIRFRVLDDSIRFLPVGAAHPDITLDADSFASLAMPVLRIFITENETNFLAFPMAKQSIVIFGAGYGWEALAKAQWLERCPVYYWGDIDTHGFAILNQLRGLFGHVSSLLMDHDTLFAHQSHWGEEAVQVFHDLPRLLPAERDVFEDLRSNRIRKNLRLEQERVGFKWLTNALSHVASAEC